jgi:hypothetical protein
VHHKDAIITGRTQRDASVKEREELCILFVDGTAKDPFIRLEKSAFARMGIEDDSRILPSQLSEAEQQAGR